MEVSEEIFDRVHQSLTRLGMKIEKADLESSLIKSGEERLQLIRWALSELGIVVKEENDIPKVVIELGLCPPNGTQIVLGNCTAQQSMQFWMRLFHMIHIHKSVNAESAKSSYENNCNFWLRFPSGPEYRNQIQQKVKKEETRKCVNSKSNNNKLQEELAEQRMTERKELEEMERMIELEKDNEDSEDKSEVSGEKEIEDTILLAARFQEELSTLSPWMSNEVKDEKLSKLIPNIGEKMNKLKLFCEDAQKILKSENIKNTELGEPSTGDLELPQL